MNCGDAKNCLGVYYPPLLVGLDLTLIEGCAPDVLEPREVANAALFLASDEARYITGAALPLDAGSVLK